MKNHYQTLLLIAAIVMGLSGTAYASEEPVFNASPVITNVWFAKMINANDTLTFALLPTGYVGLNDFGRLTFITGAPEIPSGDYALIQLTRNGPELIKTLKITKSGNATTEYTVMRLELNKEDLVEPLYFPDLATSGQTGSLPAARAAATTIPAATGTNAPGATATKAPAGLAPVLAGLCIAGLIGVMRSRR